MVIANLCSFFAIDDASSFSLVNLVTKVFRMYESFFSCLPKFLFQRLKMFGCFKRFLQQAERIARFQFGIGLLAEPLSGLAGLRNQFDNFLPKIVLR